MYAYIYIYRERERCMYIYRERGIDICMPTSTLLRQPLTSAKREVQNGDICCASCVFAMCDLSLYIYIERERKIDR